MTRINALLRTSSTLPPRRADLHWREESIADLEAVAMRSALAALDGDRKDPGFTEKLFQRLLRAVLAVVPRGTERRFFLALAGEFDRHRKGWREVQG